jgi:hypothetical protein
MVSYVIAPTRFASVVEFVTYAGFQYAKTCRAYTK